MQQEVYNCVKIIRMSHVIHLQYRHVDATTASKGNRGDIFHPGQRAKHHRVGTVSLSLFFFLFLFLSFFSNSWAWLNIHPPVRFSPQLPELFQDKSPPPKKRSLVIWLTTTANGNLCQFFFFFFFCPRSEDSTAVTTPTRVVAFCRLIWGAEGDALEIALTRNVSRLTGFFLFFSVWSLLNTSLWSNSINAKGSYNNHIHCWSFGICVFGIHKYFF